MFVLAGLREYWPNSTVKRNFVTCSAQFPLVMLGYISMQLRVNSFYDKFTRQSGVSCDHSRIRERPQFHFDVIHKADEFSRDARWMVMPVFENCDKKKAQARKRQIKRKLLKIYILLVKRDRISYYSTFLSNCIPFCIKCRLEI